MPKKTKKKERQKKGTSKIIPNRSIIKIQRNSITTTTLLHHHHHHPYAGKSTRPQHMLYGRCSFFLFYVCILNFVRLVQHTKHVVPCSVHFIAIHLCLCVCITFCRDQTHNVFFPSHLNRPKLFSIHFSFLFLFDARICGSFYVCVCVFFVK